MSTDEWVAECVAMTKPAAVWKKETKEEKRQLLVARKHYAGILDVRKRSPRRAHQIDVEARWRRPPLPPDRRDVQTQSHPWRLMTRYASAGSVRVK